MAILAVLSLVASMLAQLVLSTPASAQPEPCAPAAVNEIVLISQHDEVRSTGSASPESSTLVVEPRNAAGNACQGVTVNYGDEFATTDLIGAATANDKDIMALQDTTGLNGRATFVRDARQERTQPTPVEWRVWVDLAGGTANEFDPGEVNLEGDYESYDAIAQTISGDPTFSRQPFATAYTITATLRDQRGRGLPGEDAFLSVFQGPNSGTDDGPTVTDANGQAVLGYMDTASTATDFNDDVDVCHNPGGVTFPDCDAANISDLSPSTHWQHPTTLDLTPNTADPAATNPAGTDHDIVATLTDQIGFGIEGQRISGEIVFGPNIFSFSVLTDPDGEVALTYDDNLSTPGDEVDTICAWWDANDSFPPADIGGAEEDGGLCDRNPNIAVTPGSTTDTENKTWEQVVAGPPANIECVAGCDEANPVGAHHTFTIRVSDAADVPVPGEEVLAEIESGPHADFAGNGATRDFACETAANGECVISDNGDGTHVFGADYVGTAGGQDSVRFWLDDNANLRFDAGELNTTSTKGWFGAPQTLTLAPPASSAAVGACNSFTATLEDADGNPVSGEQVHVRQVHADDTALVGFCPEADVDGPNPSGVTVVVPGTDDLTGETNESTNADGQVSFAINSNTVGDVTVQAFWDENGNNVRDPGEPQGTSAKTWTPGGPEAAETLDAEPETDTNPTGTDHEIEVEVRNADGDGIPGVDVRARIDSGPNQAQFPPPNGGVWCTTGNDGSCTGDYTGTGGIGTDNFTFWVNTGDARDTTPGPDAQEPQDQVSKDWVAPEGDDILVECLDHAAGDFLDDFCVLPTDQPLQTIRATVTEGGNPVAGARVDFDESNANTGWEFTDTGTQNTSCDTDADGQCEVELENTPAPADGDLVDIRGTLAGTAFVDTAQTDWEDRVADDLRLEPEFRVNQTGGSHTVVATLTDQFGDPMAGRTVDIFNDAPSRNALGVTCAGQTTDAAGEVDCTYNDTGNPAVAGDDFMAAEDVATGLQSNQARKRWIPEATVAAEVAIDMEACDGNLANFNDASWDDTAAPNDVGETHEVCASGKTAGGEILHGHDMNFTLTGVGNFVDDDGNDIGTSTTATIDASGYASVDIRSTEVGTSNVTVEMDGQTDSGDKPWQGRPARFLELDPATDENVFGSNHIVTGIVTDAHGNPVPGQQVRFELSGDGTFSDGTCCVKTETTNAQGRASVSITHDAVGSSTVDATIQPGVPFLIPAGPQGNECNEPANSPEPGDPAGVCDAQAQKDWVDEPPPPALCPGFEHLTGHIHIVGTPGDDVLIATSDDPHVICGLAGDDHIEGGAGDDVLDGGPGDDVMFGRDGDDVMFGRSGNDDMRGGPGDDIMRGGPGNDVLRGGPGDDQIFGGDGADTIFGGSGNDVMRGGPGNDVIRTGPGDNIARAGSGSNRVIGGSGNNNLHGGSGDDLLRASGNGDNRLRGAGGDDRLVGAPGPNSSTRFHCGPGFDIAVLRGGTNFVHPSCNQVVDQT